MNALQLEEGWGRAEARLWGIGADIHAPVTLGEQWVVARNQVALSPFHPGVACGHTE